MASSESFFKSLIEHSDNLFQVFSEDSKVLYSSFVPESLMRYVDGQPEPLLPFQWIHPDDRERVWTTFEAHKKAGFQEYLINYRLITSTGGIVNAEARVIDARDNPDIGGYVLIIHNITKNALAKEKISRQQSMYQLMIDVSKGFLNGDIQSAVEAMVKRVGVFTGVDRCYVYLLNESKRHWSCLYEWRSDLSASYPSNYHDDGLSGDIVDWTEAEFRAGRMVRCEHLDELPPEADGFRSACEADSTQSILLLPMLTDQRLIGFIGFDSVVRQKVWSDDDVAVLDICTEVLASALLRVEAEKSAQQSQREALEKIAAHAQLESLKTQVNPHFLFNSLNVLASLVHIDANLSEQFIEQLARSYRYLLEQKDKDLVPLQTEVNFVQAFAFLLKIRFEEKLCINIQLSASVLSLQVAPLTLQLLIENAVKHNSTSYESPLVIDIGHEGTDWLVVRNNLQIREHSAPSSGLGLKNIKARYALFTKREPRFFIANGNYVAMIPLLPTHQ
jgi:PAS domain S-box-containing protein